jgi:Ala-tRNA(Pro) deacylase
MSELISILKEFEIPYDSHQHVAVHTCEQAYAAIPDDGAVQTKNIFLRDKRGRRHLLLVTSCEKAVDIKRFADQADADHLSFASPERLMKYLGVEPGSVTVLGLINDAEHAVELYVDADIWNTPRWRCHPLVNTATWVISRTDLERFFAKTGHKPIVLTLAVRESSGNP